MLKCVEIRYFLRLMPYTFNGKIKILKEMYAT